MYGQTWICWAEQPQSTQASLIYASLNPRSRYLFRPTFCLAEWSRGARGVPTNQGQLDHQWILNEYAISASLRTSTTENDTFRSVTPQDRHHLRPRDGESTSRLDGSRKGTGNHHQGAPGHDVLHRTGRPKVRINLIDTPGHVDFATKSHEA